MDVMRTDGFPHIIPLDTFHVCAQVTKFNNRLIQEFLVAFMYSVSIQSMVLMDYKPRSQYPALSYPLLIRSSDYRVPFGFFMQLSCVYGSGKNRRTKVLSLTRVSASLCLLSS
jgi:hypothetical protein